MAPSPAAVTAIAVLFGAGIGLVLPSVDATISEIVTKDFRAGALSLRNSATGLGLAAGPLLFTALAAATGYRFLLLVAGIVTLTGGVGAIILGRQ